MTLHFDPSTTFSVRDLPQERFAIITPDFTIEISEQQAADLIDALSSALHEAAARWELTNEGQQALNQTSSPTAP